MLPKAIRSCLRGRTFFHMALYSSGQYTCLTDPKRLLFPCFLHPDPWIFLQMSHMSYSIISKKAHSLVLYTNYLAVTPYIQKSEPLISQGLRGAGNRT